MYTKNCKKCGTEISYNKRTKPVACPNCGAIKWDKEDNELNLFALQDKILNTNDTHLKEQYLQEMLPHIESLAMGMILKKLGTWIATSGGLLHEYAIDTTLAFHKQLYRLYLVRGLKVETSFSGWLYRVADGVLFNSKLQANQRKIVYMKEVHDREKDDFDIAEHPTAHIKNDEVRGESIERLKELFFTYLDRENLSFIDREILSYSFATIVYSENVKGYVKTRFIQSLRANKEYSVTLPLVFMAIYKGIQKHKNHEQIRKDIDAVYSAQATIMNLEEMTDKEKFYAFLLREYKGTNLAFLYSVIDNKSFYSMIKLMEGKAVRFPTIDVFNSSIKTFEKLNNTSLEHILTS